MTVSTVRTGTASSRISRGIFFSLLCASVVRREWEEYADRCNGRQGSSMNFICGARDGTTPSGSFQVILKGLTV